MDETMVRYRRRGREACLSHADNIWFTEVLRAAISPLELFAIDGEETQIELTETLAGHDGFVVITSPEGRGPTLRQLQKALRRSDGRACEPFRSTLPSRTVLYTPKEGAVRCNAKFDDSGRTIEVFLVSNFHFVYHCDDMIANAFSNKFMRLMDKHLTRQFAIVNSQTDQVVQEILSGAGLWAGPDVVESCRRMQRRYIHPTYSGTDTRFCIAPLPVPADGGRRKARQVRLRGRSSTR